MTTEYNSTLLFAAISICLQNIPVIVMLSIRKDISSYFYVYFVDVVCPWSIMKSERATNMLDDYKYSIGRLVVYEHTDPKLPKQSYGHYGHQKTVGEVLAVEMNHNPLPHWVYTIQNLRNGEVIQIGQEFIKFAMAVGKQNKKSGRKYSERRIEDAVLAEMIAKALSNPARENILQSALRDILYKEELTNRAYREGAELPVYSGDYIRIRGDLRKEIENVHNHYAKILHVSPSDIAGIENADAKPGHPTVYRTLKKYKVLTSEQIETEIYDAEIKLFYTAHSRKTILNWRAATLLAETFNDEPPYKLEYEYLSDHIFTRDEFKGKKRSELCETLASMLYVKGRIGWRDYQRRHQFFAATPKSHIIDNLLEISRFDYRKNRNMTAEEIVQKQQDCYKLRRLLKSG